MPVGSDKGLCDGQSQFLHPTRVLEEIKVLGWKDIIVPGALACFHAKATGHMFHVICQIRGQKGEGWHANQAKRVEKPRRSSGVRCDFQSRTFGVRIDGRLFGFDLDTSTMAADAGSSVRFKGSQSCFRMWQPAGAVTESPPQRAANDDLAKSRLSVSVVSKRERKAAGNFPPATMSKHMTNARMFASGARVWARCSIRRDWRTASEGAFVQLVAHATITDDV